MCDRAQGKRVIWEVQGGGGGGGGESAGDESTAENEDGVRGLLEMRGGDG